MNVSHELLASPDQAIYALCFDMAVKVVPSFHKLLIRILVRHTAEFSIPGPLRSMKDRAFAYSEECIDSMNVPGL